MAAGVEFNGGAFVVDAALVGELLQVPPPEVPALMQAGAITSVCEQGVDDDAGRFRLSFFYRNRRARINLDAGGRVLRKSVVDFGDRQPPKGLRRASF